MICLTFTYERSVSINSITTLRNFSASESWREPANMVLQTDDAADPVGLDFRVSCGDRQKPVT